MGAKAIKLGSWVKHPAYWISVSGISESNVMLNETTSNIEDVE